MKYIYEPIYNPILKKWEVKYGNEKNNLNFKLFPEENEARNFADELSKEEEAT